MKDKLRKAVILSVIFTLFFHIITVFAKWSFYIEIYDGYLIYEKVILEILLVTVMTVFIFSILLFLKCGFLIPFIFIISTIATYYLINFNKFLDVEIIKNIYSVEADLTWEYIGWELILFSTILLGVPFLVYRYLYQCTSERFIRNVFIACLFILPISIVYDSYRFARSSTKSIMKTYMPFSLIHHTYLYNSKYSSVVSRAKEKVDITKIADYTFENNSEKPLNLVLIIGESLRGDLLHINNASNRQNTPNLEQIKNLISFSHAYSKTNKTNIAVPYILTRANHPNLEASHSETSIISIFKHLGFKTAWIGSQGMLSEYEYSYAPLITEAEDIVVKRDIKSKLNTKSVYDEHIIHFLNRFLDNTTQENNFIVMQMFGNHWVTAERYPEGFEKWGPVCNSKSPALCSNEQLKNTYHNATLYTDYVLNSIIRLFEDKNALVFFVSDHGFSMREDNKSLSNLNMYNDEELPEAQKSIAMFVWASSYFLDHHNLTMQQLRKYKDEKLGHEYIFHSLLGCIGVETDIIEYKYNLCALN